MTVALEQGVVRDANRFNVADNTAQYIAQAVTNSGSQDSIVLNTRSKARAVIEVSNRNGGAALTECKVWGMVNGGDWMQLLGNAAGDYTTPIGPLKYCFGANNAATSPITLAANAKVVMVLEVGGFDQIKLTVNCGTATTLDVYGQAS